MSKANGNGITLSNEAKEFEKHVLAVLTTPDPKPKYELWQQVKGGKIVGFYWESVSYAYHNQTYPGWWYSVLAADEKNIENVHEADINAIEATPMQQSEEVPCS